MFEYILDALSMFVGDDIKDHDATIDTNSSYTANASITIGDTGVSAHISCLRNKDLFPIAEAEVVEDPGMNKRIRKSTSVQSFVDLQTSPIHKVDKDTLPKSAQVTQESIGNTPMLRRKQSSRDTITYCICHGTRIHQAVYCCDDKYFCNRESANSWIRRNSSLGKDGIYF